MMTQQQTERMYMSMFLLKHALSTIEHAIEYAERKKVMNPCELKIMKANLEIMIKKLEVKL